MTEQKKRGRPKKNPEKESPKPTPPAKKPPKDPVPQKPGYVVNPQHPLDVEWARNPNYKKVKHGSKGKPGLYVNDRKVDVDIFNKQAWMWEAPCEEGYGIYTPVHKDGVVISAKRICDAVAERKRHGNLH